MTPDELAALHAQCFTTPRPWSADEFRDLLAMESTSLVEADHGFVLLQTASDSCEILTLAIDPEHRRKGLAFDLVQRAKTQAKSTGCSAILLEVAEDNVAARALYTKSGFRESGRRKDYYRQSDGTRVSARVLVCALDQADLP